MTLSQAAKLLAEPDPAPDFIRASGDVNCTSCGKPYRKHPHTDHVDWDGNPWLHKLCDGTLVKL